MNNLLLIQLIVLILFFLVASNVDVVIRTCMDQDLNAQCGVLTFNDEVFRGCMYTCQNNMCNQASPILKLRIHVFILYLMFLFV